MKKILIALAIASLAACSDNASQQAQPMPVQQYQQPAGAQVAPTAQGPIIVNQPAPQHDSGNMVRDMLLGGMIGNMLGSRSAAPAAPVIERRTIITRNVTVNTPTALPKPPANPGLRPSPSVATAPARPSLPSYGSAYSSSKPTTSYSSAYRGSTSTSSRSSFGGPRR